jgi:hypothetical protein
MTFDAATLELLRTTPEVCILAGRNKARPVTIWIVVVDDAVFVRSVRGPRGKWNTAARADGQATLEVDGRQLPVQVAPVGDAATVDAVGRAFLTKYAASPYAKSMAAPETLPTTLRLDPA